MKKFTFTIAILFSILAFTQQSVSHYSHTILDSHSKSFNDNLLNPVDNSQLDTLILNILSEINPDSIEQTMLDLQDFGTRFMLAPNRKNVANWIQQKFINLGIPNTMIDSFQTHTDIDLNNLQYDTITWQYNIIATIPGKHNPDDVYMSGGHYDCITDDNPMVIAPGADDNASGVATVIEIARIIHEAGFEPNSTIKLAAFAAEELMHFSSESGASHYVNTALNTNENIVLFINNDMTANSVATSDWKFTLLNHGLTNWETLLGQYVSEKYTSLTPISIDQGEYGADDKPFYEAGIPALFMMEDEFSPHYHSNTDLVENCNMGYCAELTKVTAAMLVYTSESPMGIGSLYISNPGDGSSLIPVWDANKENDLAGYKVYIGRQSNIYDTVYTCVDTTMTISDLQKDSTYFIGISAYNNDGNESKIFEKSDIPVLVHMVNGILIVSDSEGGLYDPTTEDILQFYDSICLNFQHTQLDAHLMDNISLGTLGNYSSVLWHINSYDWESASISNSTDALRNYINLGGHVFFTIYKPGKIFENINSYPATYNEGSFLYDFLHIEASENAINRWFSGAFPAIDYYNPIYIDSLKVTELNHCIPYVEAITPTENGETIYYYDTNFDTTSTQGSYYGKSVGIQNAGQIKNMVILSFPLFYTDYNQARSLIYDVMFNKFGETYLDIEHQQYITPTGIKIFPNPANNEFSILLNPLGPEITDIKIFSIEGKLIRSFSLNKFYSGGQTIKVDISKLDRGMYILQVISGEEILTDKLLKQ